MTDEGWRRPFGEAVAFLGGRFPGDRPDPVVVTGTPSGLPSLSGLPVGDIAVACVATALSTAARLQQYRSGRPAPLARLDAGHVAAAVRSEAWLRLGGSGLGSGFGSGFAPLSRFWRAADGWVRTHANYPWHREALTRVLGTGADPDAAGAAIGERRADDIEAAVTAAGGVAAAVRTVAQWQAHPQGRAAAGQPLIGSARRDGAAPRRREAAGMPAAGLRVLDLTRVIAGPVATRYLAALGADVLRVDPPHRPELRLHRYDGLPGKRSAILDARTPGGLERLHELLDGADVLVHGYRPGALAAFGLSPASLAGRHPGLVSVSLSAWGTAGPWRDRRGFDSIVQAASGIAMAESPDGHQPGRLPCQLLDHGTGYLAAAAALTGVRRQAEAGGTHAFELSLAATAAWLLAPPLAQPRPGTSASESPAARSPAAPPDARSPAAPPDARSPAAPPDSRWQTTLHSSAGPVTMITPPGRLGRRAPGWPPRLADYGQDPPTWAGTQTPG